ncbi:MAG: translocation/assembly module TamB domain-containing protein [Proteobacteria bacterium]|nr:translocation/assembly module TamB domain-containing protein [Pseudomonadota bacterium]
MNAPPPAAPARPTPRVRLGRIAARATIAVVVAALASVLLFFAAITTDTGLPYVMREIARLTDGRLTVDGASGSLLSTFRARELRWQGPTTRVIARDVLVTWSPWALAQRRLAVATLGAGTIDVKVASDGASPATLPDSLGLPLDVAIDHASVTTLDWAVGERTGRVTGIAFGYTGDARTHALTSLLLGFEEGHVAGNVTLGAAKPFPAGGRIEFTGSDRLAGVTLATRLGGTLAALTVDADGRADDATVTGHAELTPFTPAPLARLDVDARNVDTARFVPSLPATRIDATLHATPAPDGFTGTLSLVNVAPGRLDAARLPVESLRATFAQSAARFALSDLDVALAGGGRVRGRGDITLAGDHASTWSLELAGVNLAALHSSLVPTRLAGRVDATLDGAVQRLEGNVADADRRLALDFAARLADGEAVLTRGRLGTAYGSVEATGRVALAEPRAFTLEATARHFDPATLAAVAHGTLDAGLTVRGVLAPALRASVDGHVAPTSTWGGEKLAATLRADLARGSASGIAVDATLGSTHATLDGALGRPGATLAWTLAAPTLAELAKLHVAGLPPTLAGALQAKGTVAYAGGPLVGAGLVVDARATKLVIGAVHAEQATLQANVAQATGPVKQPPRDRSLALTLDADGIAGPLVVDHAHAALDGTVDAHTLTVALAARGDRVDATVKGGLATAGDALHWRGTLAALDTRGKVKLALAAPATLEFSAAHVALANVVLGFDGGRVDVARFAWDHGRIDTAGQFSALPLASIAQVAGQPLPMRSTLTLRGAWRVAAAPRLDGTFRVERDAGDLYASDPDNPEAPELAIGLHELVVAGTLANDALAVDARIASDRAGNATLTASVAAGTAPGRIATDTPFTLKLAARLGSLALLEPWLGTTAAIDGRAVADVSATGTLRAPVWSGTIDGDGIRMDSPQWGLQVSDGRIRARLLDDVLQLDEFSVRGGDGTFVAHGTLARNGAGADDDAANITWQARNFRLLNRPDRHFVVNGDGRASLQGQRLALSGRVDIVEGRIAYEPLPPLLGDDVVIKGRPRPPADDQLRSTTVQLDFDVNLGNRVTFTGMGLEARLGGRVHVTTGPDGLLQGRGTIRTLSGTYYAFGQRLVIDRGVLYFDGLLANPGLDVVALRRNTAVEAGVQLTGTVRLPRLALVSNPPVPDNEKLAWLITGQPPGRAGSADAAAIAAASSVLLANGGKPITTTLAQRLGLDDISVHQAQGSATTAGGTQAQGQVIAFGKQLTDRLTLVYEQGLTVATNALRLDYRLSRFVTVRAEAGLVSGIGIAFRRSFP